MSWFKPRTVRGQLLGGLILLEGVLLLIFGTFLLREQTLQVRDRAEERLRYQVTMLALQARASFVGGQMDALQEFVSTMPASSSIRAAQVTDIAGRILVSSRLSEVGRDDLSALEKQHLRNGSTEIFAPRPGAQEGVAPVYVHGEIQGFAWVYGDSAADARQIRSLFRITLLYAFCALAGAVLVALLLARSITQPLAVLLKGTRQLIRDPSGKHRFPLPITSFNEAADLTVAFNLMVASIEEQRAGLNDTLALLDSMLANAPIGFAFFDRRCRFVRVNRFLAELNMIPVGRHLGRAITEVFPPEGAAVLERHILSVFQSGLPVQDIELSGELPERPGTLRHWLVNVYPVKTSAQAVRWVGAVVVDTTERRRSEDALRKTEKLAAAGRLAASIAHEINNPLEAVTNLLFLLNADTSLSAEARTYAEEAQHQVARVAEITQQTLRFYRQSTLPVHSNLGELLDSVLALHQGRLHGLNVEVVRRYGPNIELHSFAGELRQLFANLIGNAVDAMPQGGRLTLTVRRSLSWSRGAEPVPGVRVFVADTGVGMTAAVRNRIFEPFFTTKEVTGTGLGLWVSAEIIRKHHASVTVRSSPAGGGRRSGTVFMLFFPSEMEPVAVEAAALPRLGVAEAGTRS